VTEFTKQEWTIETVKDHVIALMDERDKRYEQRFQSSQKAIDEAKAETQKRFENTNEWRGMVADTQKTYVTRSEVFALVGAAAAIIGIVIEILNFAMFQHK
jgi:hypothetical protein